MVYGFDDNKAKVNINSILSGLETNYQNNVNTVYNAVVNNGVTPTAKTPSAIVTGINNIRSGGNAAASEILANKTAYSGKTLRTGSMANYSGSNRRTVTPTGGTGNEQLSLAAGYHDSVIVNRTAPYNAGVAAQKAITWDEYFVAQSSGYCSLRIDTRNITKIKNNNSYQITYATYGGDPLTPGSSIRNGDLAANSTLTLQSNEKTFVYNANHPSTAGTDTFILTRICAKRF